MFFLFLVILTCLGVLFFIKGFSRNRSVPSLPLSPSVSPEKNRWEFAGVYQKKKYLFDVPSEFYMYKILLELFGDRYYIFPQMNLNHLVGVVGGNGYYGQKFWTRINKKSVDFVLCDKVRVVPQLAIELDGTSHSRQDRMHRDLFVDSLMKDIGLPIVHLNAAVTDRIIIKNAVLNKISSHA